MQQGFEKVLTSQFPPTDPRLDEQIDRAALQYPGMVFTLSFAGAATVVWIPHTEPLPEAGGDVHDQEQVFLSEIEEASAHISALYLSPRTSPWLRDALLSAVARADLTAVCADAQTLIDAIHALHTARTNLALHRGQLSLPHSTTP
jgi:hypothetical protein